MRRANTCDPALTLLNEEIISDEHKQNIWKEHLDAHWDHRFGFGPRFLVAWGFHTICADIYSSPTHVQAV